MSAATSPPLAALTERLERASSLDRPVGVLSPVISSTLGRGGARRVLSGSWMGHALHPLLTDVPIGTWTSALILDFFGGASGEDAADLLVAVGLLAVAPTALSGWSDWSESKTASERRVGVVHAASNITAASLFAASLRRRREGRRASGKLLSVAGAGALTVGGYLGGHLSYARGTGVRER